METYTEQELLEGLRAVGVSRGDLLFFQPRLYGLGRPEGVGSKQDLCEFYYRALLEALGPEGTLVVQTFTTQVARHDIPFQQESTQPDYGLFSEYVVGHPDFIRSLHPLQSVAATGPLSPEICHARGTSNFGARSPFDKLVSLGAKNLFLGVEIKEAVSLVHYIEMHYGCVHLYNKLLRWRPLVDGMPRPEMYTANLRYLEYQIHHDCTRFQDDLFERGLVCEAQVGGGMLYCLEVPELIEAGYDGLEQDPFYFLAETPDFDYGTHPYDGPALSRERLRDGTSGEEGAPPAETGLPALARWQAPQFAELLQEILERQPARQRKTILNQLRLRPESYYAEAELLVDALLRSAARREIRRDELIDAYTQICVDTLKEQIEYRRTGSYSVDDYQTALDQVYLDGDVMRSYMDGLLLTTVLWDNHWKLLRFMRSYFLAPYCCVSEQHLEVGPGHGWYSYLALSFGARQLIGFDVSPHSLELTRCLLETQGVAEDRYELHLGDVKEAIPLEDHQITTAVAGEVLEHIPDPAGFLREIYRVLRPGGVAYVTTAANAPAIDHLYHFRSAQEIREMITAAGFGIERDLVIEHGMIGDEPLINYGGVLRKPVGGGQS